VSPGCARVGLDPFAGRPANPLEFLCIPPLVFAAFRFGQREAATCVALLAGIAIRGTLEGFGPFVRSSQNESLLPLQAFMATLIDDVAAPRRRRIEELLEVAGRIQAIVARMKHLTRVEMMDGPSHLPEMLDIRKSSERRSGETGTGGGSEAAVAGLQIASRYLVIVAHEELSRHESLKDTFADESADVILDWRMGERRRRHVLVEVERRSGDRRRRDITTDLQKHDWAIVRNRSTSSAPVPSGGVSA